MDTMVFRTSKYILGRYSNCRTKADDVVIPHLQNQFRQKGTKCPRPSVQHIPLAKMHFCQKFALMLVYRFYISSSLLGYRDAWMDLNIHDISTRGPPL